MEGAKKQWWEFGSKKAQSGEGNEMVLEAIKRLEKQLKETNEKVDNI